MKSNPFSSRILSLLLAILTVSSSAHSQPKPQTAQETVATFYEAYLQALSKERDPFTQDKPFIRRYVAASLIAEIDKKMKSPDGLEMDYFIQGQDYPEDWKGHISISEIESKMPTVATFRVKLGQKQPNEWRLKVTLKKEAGVWKISRVQSLSE